VEEWEDELRPDKCHVIFEQLPGCKTYVALCDPRHPSAIGGAALNRKVDEILKRNVPVVAGMNGQMVVKAPDWCDTEKIISELKQAYHNYVRVI
jgi:hypothetical protein